MTHFKAVIAAAMLALCTGSLIQGTAAAAERSAGADAMSGTRAVRPTRACAALAGLRIAGTGLTLTQAAEVPAARPGTTVDETGVGRIPVAVPAYCRARGIIDPHTGPDGKSYGLTVELALPDAWNGRFLFQGGGGLNGVLRPPLGDNAAGDRPALARGFAVVSTDGGHRGAVFDSAFLADQQAALDFAFKAVPTVAVAAKRTVAIYYGKPAAHSYFDGCSTGGREGMEAVERYPMLFDGVISGAPAMRTGYSNIALKWAAVAFNRIAPRDPSTGRPIPGGAFSPADRQLIVNGVLKACDALDGVKDGMIFDARACRFDPIVLECKGSKVAGCLSRAQVDALHTAFAGPVAASGRRIYVGRPYDTGIAAHAPGPSPGGFLLTSTAGPVAGDSLPLTIDLEAEQASVEANALQQLTDTDRWTNLGTFAAHGGKQIFYHGMSDPWFSPLDTIDYYERLAHASGGLEKTRGFARLFLVPGMGHCAGGPATLDHFDLLTPLVDWVERGEAPRAVTATGRDFPGRSRPLCAWPLHAQYRGHGDTNEAASFECRE
ncbi:MAG: tannase/feruloyl esterase family alpha/beta hydrolase [Steroidobacteraceae bacterium]